MFFKRRNELLFPAGPAIRRSYQSDWQAPLFLSDSPEPESAPGFSHHQKLCQLEDRAVPEYGLVPPLADAPK
jgi:hypothetical protein